MASVDIGKVDKFFGSTQVLHGVEIEIGDGEFVVLVGPSGCGKSTLLRMIAGLEEISRGEIAIGGRVVNNVPPKDRDIAMVFQNYALYPHMTVYDNMAFSLKLAKAPKDEIQRRVQQAAEILGLQPFLARYPRQLSGGQRQRVAMGRAIVRDPQVFLFDEPLSNLDAKLRVQMRTEIKELHQRLKTTSVYVTHDQIEAMTMADRIVVMHDGVVEQIGEPLGLYDKPSNLFVAGFIGSPAMNFIDATIKRERRRSSAVAAGRHAAAAARDRRRAGRPEGRVRHPAGAPRSHRRRRRPAGRGRGGRADRRRDPGVHPYGGAGSRRRVQGTAPVQSRRQDQSHSARRHDSRVRQGDRRPDQRLIPGARSQRRRALPGEVQAHGRWRPRDQAFATTPRSGGRNHARRSSVAHTRAFRMSRISCSSTSWRGASGGSAGSSACLRRSWFMPLTRTKMASATMMKLMTALRNAP